MIFGNGSSPSPHPPAVADRRHRRFFGYELAIGQPIHDPYPTVPEESTPPRLSPLSSLIFSSRWLQLPLYLGLIVAQGVYVILFLKELWHLISEATRLTEQQMMLIVLGLIDVVMISNLLMMVIIGGYETFVSRLRLHNHPDQPEWLSHVNASVLKVKLAMAIIGISSVHLLKTFIAAGSLGLPQASTHAVATSPPVSAEGVMWQTIIHCVFILSALGIAYTDRIMLVAPPSKPAKH
ncbi:TIGR00645 family protein [bacterium]|nr:TIGR00645 family protein [bacterium]